MLLLSRHRATARSSNERTFSGAMTEVSPVTVMLGHPAHQPDRDQQGHGEAPNTMVWSIAAMMRPRRRRRIRPAGSGPGAADRRPPLRPWRSRPDAMPES